MTALQEQMEFSFTPGLLEQFPEFADCLRASVYGCGRPFKAVAADLDMSVSELSRKLATNQNDPIYFPAVRLPELLAATGNQLPIEWLVLKCCADPDVTKARAAQAIVQMLPAFLELARQAGLIPAGGAVAMKKAA